MKATINASRQRATTKEAEKQAVEKQKKVANHAQEARLQVVLPDLKRKLVD